MSNVDEKIMIYIASQDWPVTTEAVAKHLKISWNTAQIHLYKCVSEGLVKGKRVGRQNQWIVTDKGKNVIKDKMRENLHKD